MAGRQAVCRGPDLAHRQRGRAGQWPDVCSVIMRQCLVTIALFLLVVVCIAHAQEYTYSMEYQIGLNRTLFNKGRAPAIETYVSAFSSATGVDTSVFEVTETVRQGALTRVSECGSDAVVRLRDYIAGDLDGLVTVDIKAVKDGLTLEEAEQEPFAPSSQYEDVSDWQIERDIHPCQADYSANTRVFLNFVPALDTCADVAKFYPEAVTSSLATIGLDEPSGVTYLYILNGTYDGHSVSLTTELQYSSLENALADVSSGGGEFSYTVLGLDEGRSSFSDDAIARFDAEYFVVLEIVASDELPCDEEADSSDESTGSSEGSSTSSEDPSQSTITNAQSRSGGSDSRSRGSDQSVSTGPASGGVLLQPTMAMALAALATGFL